MNLSCLRPNLRQFIVMGSKKLKSIWQSFASNYMYIPIVEQESKANNNNILIATNSAG